MPTPELRKRPHNFVLKPEVIAEIVMKRMHVHIAVDDIATAKRFYAAMFGQEPTVFATPIFCSLYAMALVLRTPLCLICNDSLTLRLIHHQKMRPTLD